MTQREKYLTDRDRKILAFVGRYRAVTIRMIWNRYLSNTSLDNAARVVRRLVRRDLLRKIVCGEELSYILPTRLGLRIAGLQPRTPRPFTEQSLPVVLAIASYCVSNGLDRFTNSEFCDSYPELSQPGMRSSNYVLIDTSTGPKLQLIVVDRGGTPRRIKGRVRRLIAQRKRLPAFRSLMDAGRFQINVLAGTKEQHARINDYIQRHSFGSVSVTSSLVSELGNILLIGG